MVQMTARRIDPPPPYPSRQGNGFFESFVHAWSGLIHAVVHQRNMRIHILAGILVGLVGMGIPLGLAEKVTLVFCVLLIFFAEILNSALEQLVDLAVEQVHEKARLAKDAAAAGVLVLAIGTVVIFVAVVVHNWHTVVSHTEQIERQVILGVPLTACAGILMMPNPRGLWADVALFGIGCALLFALALRSESLVFTAMTFGLLIVAGEASRSRWRTRARAVRLKRDAPAETALPPRKEPSFPTRAGQP
jgi:diacylglycerol kinase (ATP)